MLVFLHHLGAFESFLCSLAVLRVFLINLSLTVALFLDLTHCTQIDHFYFSKISLSSELVIMLCIVLLSSISFLLVLPVDSLVVLIASISVHVYFL